MATATASPTLVTELPENKKPTISLDALMNGGLFVWPSDAPVLALRPLTPEERGDAATEERIARIQTRLRSDVVTLGNLDAPREEIEALRDEIDAMMDTQREEEGDDEVDEHWHERIEYMFKLVTGRSAATRIIENASRRARDLYVARVTLCDLDGNPLDFDKQNPKVQELAIEAAGAQEVAINLIPFELTK